MKQGVKTFLHVFGGIIFGGSVSCIVTYKLTAKKFMKISDERVKSLEEYIEKLQVEKLSRDLGYGDVGDSSELSEKNEDVTVSPNYISDERLKPYQEVKPDGTIYTRYSKISGDAKSAVDERYEQIAAELEHPMEDDDEDEDGVPITEAEREYERINRLGEEVSNLVNSNSPPHVIDYDDYGKSGYLDEVDLYYYAGDGTLVDDEDHIVPSPEDILGDCLDTSGFKTNSQKELYVRNYRRSTDYAITKIMHKYSDKDIY